jgi:hypothetical protein
MTHPPLSSRVGCLSLPEYEQEFLWDLTYKLRERQKRRGISPLRRAVRRSENVPEKYAQPTRCIPPAPLAPPNCLGEVYAPFEPESNSRGKRNSGNFSERHRQASHESMKSVPSIEDITRRRRHSRTLSGKLSLDRTQRRASNESVRSPVNNRTEYNWVPEGEVASHKSNGLLSGIKKSFGRSMTYEDVTPKVVYEEQRANSEDEREKPRRRDRVRERQLFND